MIVQKRGSGSRRESRFSSFIPIGANTRRKLVQGGGKRGEVFPNVPVPETKA